LGRERYRGKGLKVNRENLDKKKRGEGETPAFSEGKSSLEKKKCF